MEPASQADQGDPGHEAADEGAEDDPAGFGGVHAAAGEAVEVLAAEEFGGVLGVSPGHIGDPGAIEGEDDEQAEEGSHGEDVARDVAERARQEQVDGDDEGGQGDGDGALGEAAEGHAEVHQNDSSQ